MPKPLAPLARERFRYSYDPFTVTVLSKQRRNIVSHISPLFASKNQILHRAPNHSTPPLTLHATSPASMNAFGPDR